MSAFADKGMRLDVGEIPPDCKPVVVGIDFGTAYSGTAITYKAQRNVIHPCVPGVSDSTQIKVPTALLCTTDGEWLFGYDAEAKYCTEQDGADIGETPVHMFKRFKMALKGRNAGFETLSARSITGQSRSLLELVSVALRILKNHVMRTIGDGYGQSLTIADIQWVLTVPAIWNDFGKAFMRKAAYLAGMMSSELSENLIIVLEPEAAALAIHIEQEKLNFMCVGSRFVVLDCGGGTVDITAHEVRSVKPLSLKSIAIPTGGEWGGDCVNVEFQKFLKELLGPTIYDDKALCYDFYKINVEFDNAKKVFEPTTDPRAVRLSDVLERREQLPSLAEEFNVAHALTPILLSPLLRNGFLTMSKELMLSFFEPSLERTVEATRKVLKETPGISNIMLVGGFGSSRVVIDRVRAEFGSMEGVRVIMPDPSPKPQAAIVQGAVYFGLYKNLIDSRLSPYTYGVAMRVNGVPDSFHVLVRRGQELPEDHVVEQAGMPASAAQTAICWRVFRSDLTHPTTVKGELLLGTVTAQCPPNPNNLLRLQRGRFQFGGPEIVVRVVNSTNQEYITQIVPPK